MNLSKREIYMAKALYSLVGFSNFSGYSYWKSRFDQTFTEELLGQGRIDHTRAKEYWNSHRNRVRRKVKYWLK